MIEVFFLFAHHEIRAPRSGRRIARLDRFLEQHVHENEHRLGLEDKRPRRFCVRGVKMLMDTIVVHDGHVTGLPIVADAVMHLVAFAIQNVEGGFVDMPVLLALAAGAVFLKVQVKQLTDAVLRFDLVAAVGLRTVNKLDFGRLADPGHSAKAL